MREVHPTEDILLPTISFFEWLAHGDNESQEACSQIYYCLHLCNVPLIAHRQTTSTTPPYLRH